MNEDEKRALYEKFPSFLSSRLLRGEVVLPDDVEFRFKRSLAYRAIEREAGDTSPLTSEDMLSYHQLEKKPRGAVVSDNDPGLFAVSLYTTKDKLINVMHLPKPKKKIAVGYVYPEGGPRQVKDNGHVNWWLFSTVSFSGFSIEG